MDDAKRFFLSGALGLVIGAGLFGAVSARAELTYYADIKPVVDQRCATCHQPGEIGPFSLTSWEEVYRVRHLVAASVRHGSMPPWPPAAHCNEFDKNISLTDGERALLLQWVDEGAVQGDPLDAVQPPPAEEEPEYNLALQLTEPFVPTRTPDQYRCFILDPALERDTYIRGLDFVPGNRQIVHHAIGYSIPPENAGDARRWDADDPGPGFDCMGSVTRGGVPTNSISSWVPGRKNGLLPGGAGLSLKKGSLIIMQIHYNTVGLQGRILPDRSTLLLHTRDQVEREARSILLLNPLWAAGFMRIPAGDPDVSHAYSLTASSFLATYGRALGLDRNDSFSILSVGLHMHELGSSGRMWVERAETNRSECVLDVPSYDFGWQGIYALKNELEVSRNDRIHLECHWDNTAGNQPVVNGKRLEPRDTRWGSGTRDEMCLMRILFSRPL